MFLLYNLVWIICITLLFLSIFAILRRKRTINRAPGNTAEDYVVVDMYGNPTYQQHQATYPATYDPPPPNTTHNDQTFYRPPDSSDPNPPPPSYQDYSKDYRTSENQTYTILGIPNLFIVETIDSAKKADALNKACVNLGRQDKLKVYVQVNTSGEDTKSDVELSEALNVCQHIKENCTALELYGLMTIGMRDRDAANNPDFDLIVQLQQEIKSKLELQHFEASFGMSGDYKEALEDGSNNVRVGTAIFGSRFTKQ